MKPKKLVLCEGGDDKAIISGLCAAHGIDGISVEDYKGRDKLRTYVHGLRQRPDFVRGEIESVGITRDADEDGQAAWKSVQDAAKAAFGIVLKERGKTAGERPRVAGFIVARPGEDRGKLEDLCLAAVSQQAGYSCLEDYFHCLSEKTEKQTYDAKAKWQAWMASQRDYKLSLTDLATKPGGVSYTNPAFDSLRDFLRSL